MRRLLYLLVPALLVPALLAPHAGAQIVRGGIRFGEPAAWFSIGAGLQNGFTVRDGTTGSVWGFSDAPQYVASLEKSFGGGATFGVRGTHSRVPLSYTGATSVEADGNVSQIMGTLHIASGTGFHSVLELSAGATIYSNFRARLTGDRLAPTSDTDFAFSFAYGFGYNFSPTFSIDAVQDQSTSLHQKTGLSAGESTSSRFTTTRIVARFGLGQR